MRSFAHGQSLARTIGHYFEQTVWCHQNEMLSRRAEMHALELELARRGVSIDPRTGQVTIRK